MRFLFVCTCFVFVSLMAVQGCAFGEVTHQPVDGKRSAGSKQQTEKVGAVLSRRAYFGLGGETDKSNTGLLVTFIGDDATAARAGIQENDVITSINETAIASMADLVAVARSIRASDPVRFVVERDGRKQTMTSIAVERARETVDGLIIEYGQVDIENGTSRTITYRPQGEGPFPALFYLQGFNCASIDFGGGGDDPIRRFIEDVARSGFVVFRQEKHGAGDSISNVPCTDVDFGHEVNAFSNGLTALSALPYVDQDAVFLFGHSLGGVTAPVLARFHHIRGIASYGAPSRPWFDHIVDVFEIQPGLIGRDEKASKEKAKYGVPFLKDVMTTQMPWDAIEQKHPEAIKRKIFAVEGEYILWRHFSFLRTLNQVDIEDAWRSFHGHVLSIYGTYDIQVVTDRDARHTVELVNGGKGKASFLELENAEHGFSHINGEFMDYARKLRFGEWKRSDALAAYDARIAQEVISWMQATLSAD